MEQVTREEFYRRFKRSKRETWGAVKPLIKWKAPEWTDLKAYFIGTETRPCYLYLNEPICPFTGKTINVDEQAAVKQREHNKWGRYVYVYNRKGVVSLTHISQVPCTGMMAENKPEVECFCVKRTGNRYSWWITTHKVGECPHKVYGDKTHYER